MYRTNKWFAYAGQPFGDIFVWPAYKVPESLHPDSDISDGSWTTDTGSTILYPAIDEATADDIDYIQSSENPVNDTCEVGLQNQAGDLAQPYVVAYRYAKSNTGRQVDLTVKLIQGTTVIATYTHTDISTTITLVTQTLSSGEAAAITDFTDLRLRFTANSP